jgi:hypothetical protein
MAEGIGRTIVEVRIKRFLLDYGPEQLIDWIDQFDSSCGPLQYKKFKLLERMACEVFGITIADMQMLSRDEHVNVRRTIAHIAFTRIKISQSVIQKLLKGVSIRSVNYYIKNAEDWIAEPRNNKVFYEGYSKVIEKFNIIDI